MNTLSLRVNGLIMNEADATTPPPSRQWVADCWRIAFIAGMALITRTWLVVHTEVLSRDSIGFVRYALQIEEPSGSMSRAEVLRTSEHPPGYPLSILVVSWPVRAVMGTSSESMALSAQLASLLASLLLIVPMYYLGKIAFDRQTAFVGTLIFHVLPITAQVACDGLSDNLFILLNVTAMSLAAFGFQRNRAWPFALAGAFSGLAYLARPEGLMCVMAIGGILMRSRWRGDFSWKQFGSRALPLMTGLLLVMSPYVATIGRLTNKPTGDGLFRWLGGESMKPGWIQSSEPPVFNDVNFPLALWYENQSPSQKPGMKWAGRALGWEIFKASIYVLPFFALIGLAAGRNQLRRNDGAALIALLALSHSALLWMVATGAGYVAERHTLLIVLCECYFAAAALPIVGAWLSRQRIVASLGNAAFWSGFLAAAIVIASVPAGMKKLHANRAGHRVAGYWIAAQQGPNDQVIDPFAWAEFYSGRFRESSILTNNPRVVYVLVESNANLHPRLHAMHVARYFAERSPIVYHWPEHVPEAKAKIFVHRWEGDNFDQTWHMAHIHYNRWRLGQAE